MRGGTFVFSPENINSLLEAMLAKSYEKGTSIPDTDSNSKKTCNFSLTPSQTLVLIGLIGGVLNVESVLVDRQQTVNIILQGSLKKKTEMDKVLDKMGSMSFEEVMKALFERFA